jgi:spermidine synthase
LIGGLGIGFTLRAALKVLGPHCQAPAWPIRA